MRLCEVDDHPNEPRLLTSLLFMPLTTSSVKSVCLAHRKTSLGHATAWTHFVRAVCFCFSLGHPAFRLLSLRFHCLLESMPSVLWICFLFLERF